MKQQSYKKLKTIPAANSPAALIVVIIAAGVPFCCGKYFELSTPGAFDSGAYVYSAKHLLDGAKLGIDEIPTAQSGTLLVNITGVRLFGFSDTGPKIIQMLLQLAAFTAMFIALKKLYGTAAAGFSATIACVYLSSPLLAKFGNVKEQYLIAFAILGISFYILAKASGKSLPLFFSGAF